MMVIYKFLFKRKCEKIQSKLKIDKLNIDILQNHAENYLKKVYDKQVELFRKKMFDLMMNDEPLV